MLRQYGAHVSADALAHCADELQEHQANRDRTAVPIAEAIRMTGYSESALYRMIKRDHLENIAKSGPPVFRLGDLPFRPRKLREMST